MRSVALSAAAAAILIATPAFASSRQSTAPSAGQSDTGGSTTGSVARNGKAGGLGLTNSSLFGVGIALAATAGIIAVSTTGKSSPPVSP